MQEAAEKRLKHAKTLNEIGIRLQKKCPKHYSSLMAGKPKQRYFLSRINFSMSPTVNLKKQYLPFQNSNINSFCSQRFIKLPNKIQLVCQHN